jgi:hypothetical protein
MASIPHNGRIGGQRSPAKPESILCRTVAAVMHRFRATVFGQRCARRAASGMMAPTLNAEQHGVDRADTTT